MPYGLLSGSRGLHCSRAARVKSGWRRLKPSAARACWCNAAIFSACPCCPVSACSLAMLSPR
eukprot:3232859-Lingulodinium_polyedra.AAC.1